MSWTPTAARWCRASTIITFTSWPAWPRPGRCRWDRPRFVMAAPSALPSPRPRQPGPAASGSGPSAITSRSPATSIVTPWTGWYPITHSGCSTAAASSGCCNSAGLAALDARRRSRAGRRARPSGGGHRAAVADGPLAGRALRPGRGPAGAIPGICPGSSGGGRRSGSPAGPTPLPSARSATPRPCSRRSRPGPSPAAAPDAPDRRRCGHGGPAGEPSESRPDRSRSSSTTRTSRPSMS